MAVCGGCDVREPFEHRCWDDGCSCEECKVGRSLIIDDEGNIVTCSWFALCDRPATLLVDHRVLGSVPSCERCQTVVGAR